MAFDLSSMKVDNTKEVEGVWEDLYGGAKVRVARIGNDRQTAYMRKFPKAFINRFNAGNMEDEEFKVFMAELMSEVILLDWQNFAEDSEPLPYSKENAKAILLKYKEFRALIWDLANDVKLFQEAAVQDTAKN